MAIYGPEVGHREAEAMMILIAGTFICNYNGALTGEISDNIIGYLGNLTQSYNRMILDLFLLRVRFLHYTEKLKSRIKRKNKTP